MKIGFLAVLAGTFALACGVSWAGEYHVYSCRMPDGRVAPVDGWSETVSQINDHTADTCAGEGGLVAALDAGHSHPADTDLATWAFNAPAGETLAAATLWRAGDTAGGSNLGAEASYMFWFAGVANRGNTARPFDTCEAINGCTGRGDLKNPLAANNRIDAPSNALHSPYLSLNASCGSLIASSTCPSGGGDENGYAAVVELFAADLILTDESAPTVQEVAGPLGQAETVSGTTDVSFTADDSGSGVYEAVFQIDGETTGKVVLDANSGHCQDVGQTSDGLPAFLYTRPCAPSASADLPLDTTTLSDGAHHVVVSVTDAAGNATTVLDRQVKVANHTALAAPLGPTPSAGSAGATATASRGAANGAGASDGATLTASFRGAGVRLTSAYGLAHTVEGRLTAPGGAPIASASIEVSALPTAAGAHAAALPSARTDASGHFALRLPRTLPSTSLRLAYRSHLADTLPVATSTLTLAVKVAARLHVQPAVSAVDRTIHFSGRVLGGAIPPGGKQLVLEARSPGGRWIQFDTVRTDPHGNFRDAYRFRLPGPVSYRFRVLSRYEADYPFLAGSSNVVRVLER